MSAEPSPTAPVVACDLDGVVWRGRTPVAGSSDAVAALRRAGLRVLFVTNNAASTRDELRGRLERLGVATSADDLVTSAMSATALLAERLPSGSRVLLAGGPGLLEEVTAAGFAAVREPPAAAVVVGLHHDFTYASLAAAADAVRGGSLFVATNLDPTCPVEGRVLPGAGAIVAAVATAAGRTPVVAGKPEAPMVRCIRARTAGPGFVVGDRVSTDGRLAAALGWPFAFVGSGVDDDQEPAGRSGPAGAKTNPVRAEVTGPDLAAVAPQIITRLGVACARSR